MKNLLLLVVVLCMSSCLNDFLEVDPLTTTSTNNFWKTEADVRSALNAAYNPLKSAYKVGFIRWFEARSDNFLGNSSGADPTQDICFNRLNTNSQGTNWNNWYKMISVANYAIHFIPEIKEGIAEKTQNHLLSEAYFLRAFAYFNLYRIWGDVPLVCDPVLTTDDVIKPIRSPKEEIMKLINEDLSHAVELVDNSVEEQFLYSAGALYALCTEVAMWNYDYLSALTYSKMLLDLNRYSIEDVEFSDVCSKATTKDNIWTMNWSYTQDGDNTIIQSYYKTSNTLIPTKEIYQKWESWGGESDKRRRVTLEPEKISSYGDNHVASLPNGCQLWKWSPGVREAEAYYRECYIPIYRLADILLLRAEAFVHENKYSEALFEVNKVRRRAGLPERTLMEYTNGGSIDIQKMENDILQERQFELYGEGKRWFDLVRTGKVQTTMENFYNNYLSIYGGDDFRQFTEEWQLYWPISQDIINENENLQQTGKY